MQLRICLYLPLVVQATTTLAAHVGLDPANGGVGHAFSLNFIRQTPSSPTCPEGLQCADCAGEGSICSTGDNAGCACQEPQPQECAETPKCSDCSGENNVCTTGSAAGCACESDGGVVVPPVVPVPNNPDPNSPDPNSPDPNSPDPNSPDPNSPDPNSPDPNSPDPNNPDPNSPNPENPDPNNPDPNSPEPNDPDPEKPDPESPDPNNPDPENPVPPPNETPSDSECPINGSPDQPSCDDIDCSGTDGKCSIGTRINCNCKDKCPADNAPEKPRCIDESCVGEESGKCTIGDLTECNCKQCPKDLQCSSDKCVEKDGKCSDGEFKGCKCGSECPDPTKTDLWCSFCGGKENDKCKGDPNSDPPNQYQGCSCNDEPSNFNSPLERPAADVEEHQKVIDDLPNRPINDDPGEDFEFPKPSCNEEEWSAVTGTFFQAGLYVGFCKTVNENENNALTRIVNVKGEEVPKLRKRQQRQFRRAPQSDADQEVLNSYEFELVWSPGPEGKPRDCEASFKTIAESQCGRRDSSGDKMAYAAEFDTGSGKYSYKVTKGDKLPVSDKDCEDKCLHNVPVNTPEDIANCDCTKWQPDDSPPPQVPSGSNCESICSSDGVFNVDELITCGCPP